MRVSQTVCLIFELQDYAVIGRSTNSGRRIFFLIGTIVLHSQYSMQKVKMGNMHKYNVPCDEINMINWFCPTNCHSGN